MKNIINKLLSLSLISMLLIGFTSCEDDMDVEPNDPNAFLDDEFYSQPGAYQSAIAGVYANLTLTGIRGSGSSNIQGLDAGTSQYGRSLMNLQTISTDEAIWTYENDPGIREIQRKTWSSVNPILLGSFSRIMASVAFANEFLRQSTDDLLNQRNVPQDERAEIALYRAEAKFLRALAYYHLLDLFGKAPLYDETITVGSFQGEELNRQALFEHVETELLEVLDDMAAPRTVEFGRADQGTALMVLAKLYLNAEVYTGSPRYDDAMTYIEQLLNSGYTLANDYRNNFRGDNSTNEATSEIIFGIPSNFEESRSFGPVVVMTNGGVGSIEENNEDFGLFNPGWGGAIRLTPQFVEKFDGPEFENDVRNTILSEGRTREITDVSNPDEGFVLIKYTNIRSDGTNPEYDTFTDTAFPMFRLADVYLMYAEAHLRGGGGNISQAVSLINELRTRANGATINQSDLTLDFVLDERARELYWESHRRQDLIRFGKFSGGEYIWAFKGGSASGIPTNSIRNLYPIPAQSLSTNQNLSQNPGY
ncbi:RagB/SusD family nutrient uptake outer membrane protein [Psychroflexus planctonicus]|nr:RagB/SusD family nutrient uptake outer membrane protein [Psychroflexus planctonicus]